MEFLLVFLLAFINGTIGFLSCRLIFRNWFGISFFGILLTQLIGYLLVSSSIAIYYSKFQTILVIVPLILGLIYSYNWKYPEISEQKEYPLLHTYGIICLSFIVIGSYYFYSYYHEGAWTKLPFIDNTTYSKISSSLIQTGKENYFSDWNMYNLPYNGISPYHFTELWTTGFLSKIFGTPILKVFSVSVNGYLIFLVLISFLAIAESLKTNILFAYILALSFVFCNPKSLISNEIFLYNFLDLYNIKFQLLFILLTVIHLFSYRSKYELSILFSFILPYINIVFLFIPAFLLIKYLKFTNKFKLILSYGLIIFFITGAAWISLVDSTGGLEVKITSIESLIKLFSQYSIEMTYNLGLYYNFIYVLPILFIYNKEILNFINTILKSSRSIHVITATSFLLICANILYFKISVKILPVSMAFLAVILYSRIKNNWILFSEGISIFGITAISAFLVLTTSNFDFEQVYLIYFITTLTFYLFYLIAKKSSGLNPLSIGILSALFICITFITLKKQRSVDFDSSFYAELGKHYQNVESIHSVSLTGKSFMPMPLHVVGGQGLMLFHPNVYDTPITIFDNRNWEDKPERLVVQKLPFYYEYKDLEHSHSSKNQISFIKKYQVKFVWIENGYDAQLESTLKKAAVFSAHSSSENISFLEINPSKL